ncbi:MAG TPA: nuclear transport factor 2 family protein [Cyclobacteriaceae bacterium]|nr:nuclear transport factor 2 family protein [Cyclobacteriaceae bacterium]
MKLTVLAGLVFGLCICGKAQSAEKSIKAYFSGWQKKDWSIVAGQLADGFSFTSPAGDDHIPVEKFKEKCWVQAEYIKGFEWVRIFERGNEAFALVHVITTDNKIVRNVEFFTFSNGKIKSIEVFFGGTGAGYPSNAN